MVPVPPCVVPGTMVVKPFGTTCEEFIGAEKNFSGGTKSVSKVVPLLGGPGACFPGKSLKMMLSDWLKIHLRVSDKL